MLLDWDDEDADAAKMRERFVKKTSIQTSTLSRYRCSSAQTCNASRQDTRSVGMLRHHHPISSSSNSRLTGIRMRQSPNSGRGNSQTLRRNRTPHLQLWNIHLAVDHDTTMSVAKTNSRRINLINDERGPKRRRSQRGLHGPGR